MNNYSGVEVAIIGMAARFPGAGNIHEFWSNLANGIESIMSPTKEEILEEGEDKARLEHPLYVRSSAWLTGKEYFDSNFFGYRPEEAKLMNPQTRLFHECCWHALEDAGYQTGNNTNRIGLFAGAGSSNTNWETYAFLMNRENQVDNFTALRLRDVAFMASRVSYLLNLQGPVMFLNTACSTSLVAVQKACMSLLLRECNMALAGGVFLKNSSKKGYIYQEGMIGSKDGHCRPFDADASGTLDGEGAGVVVLKRLNEAIAEGDHIYAVIRGAAVNNDGSTKMSYTAPSIEGQYKVISKALGMAKVEPQSIGYVEAHGTATKLGDPIEVAALTEAFGKSKEKYCALGSVKSNIGHCGAAAGIAGLIKAVLAIKYRKIPPSLHFEQPNPAINFTDSPFYVNNTLKEWTNEKYPLRAGVSSFGIGGTNAHVIVEEALNLVASTTGMDHQLLLFSAKNPAALERNINNMAAWLRTGETIDLADIAFTLQTAREPFTYRRAVVCKNNTEAIDQLTDAAAEKDFSRVDGNNKPTVVFMFPGQGAQYINMCKDLYEKENEFRQIVDKCFNHLQQLTGKDLRTILFSNGAQYYIDDTTFAQPLLFIVEYALAGVLKNAGIRPDAMIGHSIGEYVAACISGVFSLEDALLIVSKRGELMQMAEKGRMLSIAASVEELSSLLAHHKDISLAAINSPSHCVVSGSIDTVNGFQLAAEQKGYRTKPLRTSHAFHSGMMEQAAGAFEWVLEQISFNNISIPFLSNLTGRYVNDKLVANARYWAQHLRQTVHFSAGIDCLLAQKNVVFIEVGPGKSLSSFVRSNRLYGQGHKIVRLVRSELEEGSDRQYLLTGIGQLWQHGIVPDWNRLYQHERRNRLSLPGYSFDKMRYPVNVDTYSLLSKMLSANELGKEKDINKWFYVPSWKLAVLIPAKQVARNGCTLIFADDEGVSDALAAHFVMHNETVVCVRKGKCFGRKSDTLFTLHPNEKDDYHRLFSELGKTNLLPERIIYAWCISSDDENDRPWQFYSFLWAIQTSSEVNNRTDKQVVLLTNNLHTIAGNANMQMPVKSLCTGLLNTIAQEYPTVYTSHIDIDLNEAINGGNIEVLYNEQLQAERGKIVALRNGYRYVRIYDKIKVLQDDLPQSCFREGGVYLITGGLGDFGYHLSLKLIKEYKARMIIIGLTPLREEVAVSGKIKTRIKLQRLQELEQAGDVLYYHADIANAGEVRQTS